MERESGPNDRWLEELPIDTGDTGVLPPPDEPERQPPPPPTPASPELGPWFPLSMLVLAAWGVLIVLAASGLAGGEPLAWLLIFGFLTLYVGFLCVGAAWFHRWRHE